MHSLGLVLFFLTVSATLMLDTSPGAAAEVYKWVDSKGRTYFGDKPPESAKTVTRIDTSAATRSSADPDANARRRKQQKLLNALSTERREREKLRRTARLEKAAAKRKCANTRRNLTLLERSNLLYTKGKDGSRQYANDAQRTQLIEQFKTTLRKRCSQS